ncbi:hypothetical protein [Desulfoscipio sp. XC116]|uniref:hypothetical protein n=1 Tax=Desulfoscipio sp. XC116 TaxID=3144975 RepID=UPI00325B40E3
MLCKDCLYFKQWKKIEASMCEKTKQPVEANNRPCDHFVSKLHMTDEWGVSAANGAKCCD